MRARSLCMNIELNSRGDLVQSIAPAGNRACPGPRTRPYTATFEGCQQPGNHGPPVHGDDKDPRVKRGVCCQMGEPRQAEWSVALTKSSDGVIDMTLAIRQVWSHSCQGILTCLLIRIIAGSRPIRIHGITDKMTGPSVFRWKPTPDKLWCTI